MTAHLLSLFNDLSLLMMLCEGYRRLWFIRLLCTLLLKVPCAETVDQ